MRRAGMPGPMPSESKQQLGQDNRTRITQRVRKGPVKFPKPLPHATTFDYTGSQYNSVMLLIAVATDLSR